MKYMIVWSISPESVRATSEERWNKPEPIEGLKVHQRWHEMGTSKGYNLIETDDLGALTKYTHHWMDVSDLKITPVVDDEEFGKALADE